MDVRIMVLFSIRRIRLNDSFYSVFKVPLSSPVSETRECDPSDRLARIL